MDYEMNKAQGQMASADYSEAILLQKMYAQQNVAGQLLGNTPPPPRTLASAMGGLAVLEKRLAETADKALRLATLIGGPVPTTGPIDIMNGNGKVFIGKHAEKPPAIRLLNDRIEFAGQRVDMINAALDAMSRTLGALDG